MIPLWAAILGAIYFAVACSIFVLLYFVSKIFGPVAGIFGIPEEKHPLRDALLYSVFWLIIPIVKGLKAITVRRRP